MNKKAPQGYYTQIKPPEICLHCEVKSLPDHYARIKRGKSFTWTCKEYIKARNRRAYRRGTNDLKAKWKVYRHRDRTVYGSEDTISWEKAEPLMLESCFYCSRPDARGLDRKDSSLGHVEYNVLPCCYRCNSILVDLPWLVKLCLRPGLTEAFEQGYIDVWNPARMLLS